MTHTYGRWQCWVCGRTISSNGLAKVNHMRRHVRDGKVTERIVFYIPGDYKTAYYQFDPVTRPDGAERSGGSDGHL